METSMVKACDCVNCPGAGCTCGCQSGMAAAASCACGSACGCEGGEQGCLCN
jgi:hypothetical protein